jgi:hypothetical protein
MENLDVSVSVKNVLNRQYGQPGSTEHVNTSYPVPLIPQDGCTAIFKLEGQWKCLVTVLDRYSGLVGKYLKNYSRQNAGIFNFCVSLPSRHSGYFQVCAYSDPTIFPAPGLGNGADGFNDFIYRIVRRNDLKFHLFNNICNELSAAKYHGLSLLMIMANYCAFHEILNAHFIECVPYFLQLELMYDGFYQFHGTPPSIG